MSQAAYNVSRQWVEQKLRQTGFLLTGSVLRVQQKPAYQSFTATFFEVTIDYTSGSTGAGNGTCPQYAIIKVTEDASVGDGHSEMLFYEFLHEHSLDKNTVNSAKKIPKLAPDFYGGESDTTNNRTVLMMEKIGTDNTCIELDWREGVTPGFAEMLRVVTTLARIHSEFHQVTVPDRYGRSAYTRQKVEFLSNAVDIEALTHSLIEKAGDLITPEQQALLKGFNSCFVPRLKTYLDSAGPQTIIHDDAHFWNFKVPVAETEPVILLDWAGWNIDFGVYDLAYAIVTKMTPAFVIAHEDALKEAYRDFSLTNGIDYPAFQRDYEFALIRQLIKPMILSTYPNETETPWRDMIAPIFTAIKRNNCQSLLY